MNKPPPETNCRRPSSFFAFAAAFFWGAALCAAAFCSCSDDPINFSYVQPYFVLDWEDAEALPKQRLSVFINFSSNVRRLDSFSVKNSNYLWNVEAPVLLQAGDRQWAGSVHLEPPVFLNGEAGSFSSGLYEVECVDAAGKSSKGNFSLGYNAALLEAKAGDVEKILSGPMKRVAVYSESSELLYFDVEKPEWLSDESVFKSVKNSSFLRRTLTAGNVICFMPKIYKDGEKSDGLE